MTFRSVYLKTIHYITEILLKVALNTLTLTITQIRKTQVYRTIIIMEWGKHLNTGVQNNHNNGMGKTFKHRCTQQS
jgi:hypothetical protein